MAPERVGLTPLGLSVAAVAAIEWVFAWVLGLGRFDPMTALGGARTAEALALLGIFHRWGGGLDRIGLPRGGLLPGLVRGLAWSGGIGALAGAALLLLFHLGIDPRGLLPVALPRQIPARAALFAVGGVLGPVAEEIFFRGVLYGFLRRWGILPAVAISTAAFAMSHAAAGAFQVAGGILFAAAYEVEGRLMAPITIHVLGNTAIFSLPIVLSRVCQW
jgi:membrane protease YdiL (CAAX protease family)